ncbi:MAG: hypothetical protein ACRD13_01620, partial [Terriglobales bacterium]
VYKTLMVAGMQFMDSYNYDVERVKRCIIHYAAPNGLIYPFCTYNSGPVYREKIEKKYSMPFDQQLSMMQIPSGGQTTQVAGDAAKAALAAGGCGSKSEPKQELVQLGPA